MSDHSTIEWTDATWNPVRGCTKISPGCAHCYAETFAERFRGVPGHPYEQGFDLRLVPEKLAEPLRWTAPKMVFVNSMSDLFHKDVPDDYIEAVVRVMRLANWHTYQVLTKRSERLRDLLTDHTPGRRRRAAHLVGRQRREPPPRPAPDRAPAGGPGDGAVPLRRAAAGRPRHPRPGRIDWVIVGGESGHGARPMDPSGSGRSGTSARLPASRSSSSNGAASGRGGTGRELDGETYDEMPEASDRPMPTPEGSRAMITRSNRSCARSPES